MGELKEAPPPAVQADPLPLVLLLFNPPKGDDASVVVAFSLIEEDGNGYPPSLVSRRLVPGREPVVGEEIPNPAAPGV